MRPATLENNPVLLIEPDALEFIMNSGAVISIHPSMITAPVSEGKVQCRQPRDDTSYEKRLQDGVEVYLHHRFTQYRNKQYTISLNSVVIFKYLAIRETAYELPGIRL